MPHMLLPSRAIRMKPPSPQLLPQLRSENGNSGQNEYVKRTVVNLYGLFCLTVYFLTCSWWSSSLGHPRSHIQLAPLRDSGCWGCSWALQIFLQRHTNKTFMAVAQLINVSRVVGSNPCVNVPHAEEYWARHRTPIALNRVWQPDRVATATNGWQWMWTWVNARPLQSGLWHLEMALRYKCCPFTILDMFTFYPSGVASHLVHNIREVGMPFMVFQRGKFPHYMTIEAEKEGHLHVWSVTKRDNMNTLPEL